MIFEQRKNKRDEIRELRRKNKLEKREVKRQRRMEKYKEGGIVYPVRFKYNRRILLLTRLRRK